MKFGYVGVVAGFLIGSLAGSIPVARAVETSKPVQAGISAEASAAMQRVGKALSANDFSFQVRTIRVHLGDQGQPLHIFHNIKVTTHRPDRLAVQAVGDDGDNDLYYDGKTVSLVGFNGKRYVRIAAPDNTPAMLDDLSRRLNVDFPLSDLVDPAPATAILSGVTSGRLVGTSTIDGKPYDHLFFSQTGGIELEAWVSKSDPALLRRVIVTYRQLAGQPSFIAEFSNWNFSVNPDSDFTFQPPAGAQQIQLSQATPIARQKGE